jgi:hypothetical protein
MGILVCYGPNYSFKRLNVTGLTTLDFLCDGLRKAGFGD